ncbi:MAG: hypothetical protein HOC71_16555 [Candidatus Latescibacteria bacterium]|jgi:hypothetical protein|nr:hypothetical protein [Candidatus Latescibacterota bacterium]
MNGSKGGKFVESLKIHVVEEIEAGRIIQSEANRKYGIRPFNHNKMMWKIRQTITCIMAII